MHLRAIIDFAMNQDSVATIHMLAFNPSQLEDLQSSYGFCGHQIGINLHAGNTHRERHTHTIKINK